MSAALEARAHWHLEIGYDDGQPETDQERRQREDDEFDGGYLGESVTCWECGGNGTIVECCDDLCHGQDWCMHGDNRMCTGCHGNGWC